MGPLDDEQVGGAHLVIGGVAGERSQLESHLCLGEHRRAERDREQDDERTAHEGALGHRDARLVLDHGRLQLPQVSAWMGIAELPDGRLRLRPEVLERPER